MTQANTAKSLETNHRVAKLIWNIGGKILTFNTARDDDRSVDYLVKRQKYTGKLTGVHWYIANHPSEFVIVNVHENLPKDVAEAYRAWEIRKDKLMGYEVLNSRESY